MSVGDSAQFTAVVLSQTGKIIEGQSVRWISADSTIARVSEQGLVRGVSVGSAIITASVGDKSSALYLNVSPGACTQAAATIEIGQTRTGVLNSGMTCLLLGEPADGWQVNMAAPALLQIDPKSNLYFAHLVLTDTQLRPIAQAAYTGGRLVTLRSELPAGSYIVWVATDGDDGAYELSVTAVPAGSEASPGVASKRATQPALFMRW